MTLMTAGYAAFVVSSLSLNDNPDTYASAPSSDLLRNSSRSLIWPLLERVIQTVGTLTLRSTIWGLAATSCLINQ